MSRDGTVDQEESLVEVVRRTPILALLAHEGPQERRVLEWRLGISRSTSHRLTRTLGDLGLVRVQNGLVGLTSAGRLMAESAERFTQEAAHVLALAPVHEVLQDVHPPFPRGALDDATITDPTVGDPFQPMRRFLELIEHTGTVRGLDIIAISPLYLEEAFSRIIGGMKAEEIGTPEATKHVLDNHPGRCHDACASGNFAVYLHRSLSFSLLVLDERMAIGIRKPGSRQLRVLVDTDDPAARHWAQEVFEQYKKEAVRMAQFSTPSYLEAMKSLQVQVR